MLKHDGRECVGVSFGKEKYIYSFILDLDLWTLDLMNLVQNTFLKDAAGR